MYLWNNDCLSARMRLKFAKAIIKKLIERIKELPTQIAPCANSCTPLSVSKVGEVLAELKNFPFFSGFHISVSELSCLGRCSLIRVEPEASTLRPKTLIPCSNI